MPQPSLLPYNIEVRWQLSVWPAAAPGAFREPSQEDACCFTSSYSLVAQNQPEIPWTEMPAGLQSMGSQEVRRD